MPILIDPQEKTIKKYGMTGLPQTLIFDKQGIVRDIFIGAMEWNTLKSRRTTEKYLNQ